MPYIKNENNRRNQLDKIITFIGENLDILGDKITNRDKILQAVKMMKEANIQVNGDLNYLLYALCKRYVKPSYNNYKKYITNLIQRNSLLQYGGDLPEILWEFIANMKIDGSPSKSNNFIGELECCVFEIYRRLIAPYEDKKIAENGDVK